MNRNTTQLGLGLIGIGKPWGQVPHAVPGESEARELIEFAYALGIRYFDTAPSYGDGISEIRLGRCVPELPGAVIATKMGEHWDASRNEPYADHSFDALCRSLDRSIERLGRIDVLQLHKTTPEALRSRDVERAWDYANSLGITRIGPSASDLESAAIAVADTRFFRHAGAVQCGKSNFRGRDRCRGSARRFGRHQSTSGNGRSRRRHRPPLGLSIRAGAEPRGHP